MSDIEQLLDKELVSEIEGLGSLELGSDDYAVTADNVSKLLAKSIELKKLEIEADDKIKTREFEQDLKFQQMKEDKKDRLWKNILTALGIAIPAGCGIWGVLKSLKFEETGTVTSMSGRQLFNSLFKFKK